MQAGEVVELRCTYDPATRGGNAPDGRKVKATLHWVSAADAVPAEVRLYNPLFLRPDPNAANFAADLNPQFARSDCRRPRRARLGGRKFRRGGAVRAAGLFLAAIADSTPGRLVFNRTVGLRDTWAKVAGGGVKRRRPLHKLPRHRARP